MTAERMTAERIRQLEETNEAMRELLDRNGLLHRLPNAALDFVLKGSDPAQLFLDQIDTQMYSLRSWEKVARRYDDIVRLGSLTGGRDDAMQSFVRLATKWLNIEWGSEEASSAICELDSGLRKQAHLKHLDTLATGVDWDPTPLLKQINPSCIDIDASSFDLPQEDVFKKSRWYLRKCQRWRTARMLAYKTVGHLLPTELTDMMRDCLCGDDADLTLAPERWSWDTEDGEARKIPVLKPSFSQKCAKSA